MGKSFQRILLLVAGFFVVEYVIKNWGSSSASSTSSTPSSGSSILTTIESGVESTVGELLGTTQSAFVTKMTPIAAQIQTTYGIHPIITMSQAALESGWGSSGLTLKANNLFGFTGDTWAAEGKSVIYLPTHEYSSSSPDQIQYFSTPGDIISKTANPNGGTDLMVNRPFRSYPTWYDSCADWAQLISGTARYATAYQDAQNGDIDSYATDVAAAGYATEPDYATQLASVGDELSGAGIA